MSTKTKTDTQQTNQYNQPSMNAFNTLTPQFQSVASGYISNPFGNPFYNLALQQGLKANATMSQAQVRNLTRNMTASGFSGGNMPGFMQSQLATAGRNASAMNSNTFMQNAFNAQQLQGQYANMAANYKPLQTGQTGSTTQTTSGLGTWLPQVAGMGLGLATGGLTGGGGFLGGMFGKGGGSMVSPNFGGAMSSGYGGFAGPAAGSLSYGGPGLGSVLGIPSGMPAMGNPFLFAGGGR